MSDNEEEFNEFDFSSLEILEPQDQDLVDHDIYNAEKNLERLKDALNNSFSRNEISRKTYEDEMLKCDYLLSVRKYFKKTEGLDETEGLDKTEETKKIQELIKSIDDLFKDESEKNEQIIDSIKDLNAYILVNDMVYQADEKKKPKYILDVPLEDKLKKLHAQEITFNKSVAKKYNIYYPGLPKDKKEKDIEEYYKARLNNTEYIKDPVIEKYIDDMVEAQLLIDYHTSSYKISSLFYDQESGSTGYNFKKIAPRSKLIEDLKKIRNIKNIMTPEEIKFSEEIKKIQNNLREKPVSEIKECIDKLISNKSTYIKRLLNKKFKVYPVEEETADQETLFERILKDKKNMNYYILINSRLTNKPIGEEEISPPENTFKYIEKKDGKKYVKIENEEDLKDKLKVIDIWKVGDEYFTEEKEYLENIIKSLQIDTGPLQEKVDKTDKIRKIRYYIDNGKDLDLELPYARKNIDYPSKKEQETTAETNKMRDKGLYDLTEYIYTFYPGSEILIKKIEETVFKYSSIKYNENIEKILFIFKNYPNKLEELISTVSPGNTIVDGSIIDLLTFDTPLIIPEELKIDLDDKVGTINRLLEYNPPKDLLEKHGINLDNYYEIIEDKNIPEIELNAISLQYHENKTWSRYKEKYEKTKNIIPKGFIKENYNLRRLLRFINRLPSRRIYRIASIKTRIANIEVIKPIIIKCLLSPDNKEISEEKRPKFIKESSELIENTIFNLSVNEEDYDSYINLIVSNRDDCEVIENLKNLEDLENLEKLKELKNLETIEKLKYILTKETITKKDEIPVQKGVSISEYEEDEKEKILKDIVDNEYIPPIVSISRPVRYIGNVEHEIPNNIIGDKYVYGGKFPEFEYIHEGKTIRNYTRRDLDILSNIFNIVDPNLDDSKIVTKVREIVSKRSVLPNPTDKMGIYVNQYTPVDFISNFEYLKTPIKTIKYTERPRLGVPKPGDVYEVIKHPFKKFGVPYDYDENKMPLYPNSLRDRTDIILEGPINFGEPKLNIPIGTLNDATGTGFRDDYTSSYYINIEYKRPDERKPIIVREGVAFKSIKTREQNKLNTCDRFKSEIDCNNPNSRGIKSFGGVRSKCIWENPKCEEKEDELLLLDRFDLDEVKYKNQKNTELWYEAINKAIKYIEDTVKLRTQSIRKILEIAQEQKTRLYYYSKKLLETDSLETSEPKLPVTYREEFEFLSKLTKESEVDTDFKYNLPTEEGYINITIYKHEVENIKVQDPESSTPTLKTIPQYCLISKEDHDFMLKKLPQNYKWLLHKEEYISDDKIAGIKTTTEYKTHIPLNYIIPTGEIINELRVIKRDDLYDAMSRTLLAKFRTDDGIIFNILGSPKIIKDAALLALRKNINLDEYVDGELTGEITLKDIIDKLPTPEPPKTPDQVIKKILDDVYNYNTFIESLNETISELERGVKIEEIEKILPNDYNIFKQAITDLNKVYAQALKRRLVNRDYKNTIDSLREKYSIIEKHIKDLEEKNKLLEKNISKENSNVVRNSPYVVTRRRR